MFCALLRVIGETGPKVYVISGLHSIGIFDYASVMIGQSAHDENTFMKPIDLQNFEVL